VAFENLPEEVTVASTAAAGREPSIRTVASSDIDIRREPLADFIEVPSVRSKYGCRFWQPVKG
jgi:hypothetical protein